MRGSNVFRYRKNCELCGSNNNYILFSIDFTDSKLLDFINKYYNNRIDRSLLEGTKFELLKCNDCGFLWQSNILTEAFMNLLYESWISKEESYNKKLNADILLFSGYAREVELITQILDKKPSDINVLDFGMGWGYWCIIAKAFGYNVKGLELSKERIDFAKSKGVEVINNLTNINEKFDFINAEQVFEHIPEPLETLKHLVKSLNNKGIIRISVPNGRNIEKQLRDSNWKASKGPIQPLEHINCFTHKTLIRMAELAGLQIINQPFLLSHRNNIKSLIRGILSKYYNQWFGTTLYFSKI